jgi:hypothetical protein
MERREKILPKLMAGKTLRGAGGAIHELRAVKGKAAALAKHNI